MATKPREWPNNAREARDQAAEAAIQGILALEPLLETRDLAETERMRRIAKAMSNLHSVAILLQDAGAPIRPINWCSSSKYVQVNR